MIRCIKCHIDKDRCDCETEEQETIKTLTNDLQELYKLIDRKKKLITKLMQAKKLRL